MINSIIFIISTIVLIGYNNTQVYAFNSQYDPKVDMIIKQGLVECSTMPNDTCVKVMETLDKKCQVEYFPSCFGNELWNPYIKHLEQLIENGQYPNDRYKEDPYLTLNNHHYGNSNLEIFN
jgi:hypothetical protein